MAVVGVELLYTFSGNETSKPSGGVPIIETQVEEFELSGRASIRVL
jgi:hypothetical protein